MAHHDNQNCYGQWSYDFTILNTFKGGFAFCVTAGSYNAEDHSWSNMDIQGYFFYIRATATLPPATWDIVRVGLLQSSQNPLAEDAIYIERDIKSLEELGFSRDGTHHVEINRPKGGNITVFLDQKLILSFFDANYTRGKKMGFWSIGGHVQISNVTDSSQSGSLFSPDRLETWGISFLLLLVLVLIRYIYKKRKERKTIMEQEYQYME